MRLLARTGLIVAFCVVCICSCACNGNSPKVIYEAANVKIWQIIGFTDLGKELIAYQSNPDGIVMINPTNKRISFIPVQIKDFQLIGDQLYYIDQNSNLCIYNFLRSILKKIVDRKVVSYIITSTGINYQVTEDNRSYVVCNNRQILLPNIPISSRVSWAPNGMYGIYRNEYSEASGESDLVMYSLVDLSNEQIRHFKYRISNYSWLMDSRHIFFGQFNGPAAIMDIKNQKFIHSLDGKFGQFSCGDDLIFCIDNSANSTYSIVMVDLYKGTVKRIFTSEDMITSLRYLNDVGFISFMLYGKHGNSVNLMNVEGEIIYKFASPDNYLASRWEVDSNGYMAIITEPIGNTQIGNCTITIWSIDLDKYPESVTW